MPGEDAASEPIGLFDGDGTWITMAELDQRLGDTLDTPVHEVIESLVDADVVEVERNDSGEPVTARLSEFGTELVKVPDDAPVNDVVQVYLKHEKEPPERVKNAWLEELRQKEGEA